MRSEINYFFVEGECEEALIPALNIMGRIEKINCAAITPEKLKRTLPKFSSSSKKTKIYIVFDTDLLTNQNNLNRFIENIKLLVKQKFSVHLLQQLPDLEGELCITFKTTLSGLYKIFNTTSKSEFKRNFINERNLKQKLEIHFEVSSFNNMWSRSLVSSISHLSHLKADFSNTTKCPK